MVESKKTIEDYYLAAAKKLHLEEQKTELEKVKEQLNSFIGKFGFTPFGVGHCVMAGLDEICIFDIPGLGERKVKLNDVRW